MSLQKHVEKYFFVRSTKNMAEFLIKEYGEKVSEKVSEEDLEKLHRESLEYLKNLSGFQMRIFRMKLERIESLTVVEATKNEFSSSKIAAILGHMLQKLNDENKIIIDDTDFFYIVLDKILQIPKDSIVLDKISDSARKQGNRYLKSLNKAGFYQ